MSVAFIVLAHDEPETLSELLAALHPYEAFVHIDKSATRNDYKTQLHLQESAHVVFNPSPVCVHWGGYSVLRAMMETLALVTDRPPNLRPNYAAFLSGRCFPLRTVSEFVTHLLDSQQVHCRAFDLASRDDPFMGLGRVTRRHWLDGPVGHLRSVAPRPVGGSLRRALMTLTRRPEVELPALLHACGSQWTAFPIELALELVAHYRSGGFDYLKNSFVPDEVAVPSYVYNTRWEGRTRFGGVEPPVGRTVAAFANFHWLRDSLQGTVTLDDLDDARTSGAYFVRKVSMITHPEVISAIESTW